MKHWHEEMPFTADNSLAELIFTENSLFFDIETTGFSAARTSLYLIGCAARKENLLIVDQFFAETPADESNVRSTKYQNHFPLMNMLTSIK